MIPTDYLYWFHKDHHSFSRLGRDHLAGSIIQGTTNITFPDEFAYALDGFALVTDNCLSLNLNSPQFVIAYTSLCKTGKPAISPQVERLLRLRIRPEHYLVIYQHIPHRYQVRPPIMVNGGYLNYTLRFKKYAYLSVIHTDQVSTVHVFSSSSVSWSVCWPSPLPFSRCLRSRSSTPRIKKSALGSGPLLVIKSGLDTSSSSSASNCSSNLRTYALAS